MNRARCHGWMLQMIYKILVTQNSRLDNDKLYTGANQIDLSMALLLEAPEELRFKEESDMVDIVVLPEELELERSWGLTPKSAK